jgi:predicted component of type VI protein secretion system
MRTATLHRTMHAQTCTIAASAAAMVLAVCTTSTEFYQQYSDQIVMMLTSEFAVNTLQGCTSTALHIIL